MDFITPESEAEEIVDENGETVDVKYHNLESKEYEVMAVVEIPYCMDVHYYNSNSVQLVLPLEDMTKYPETSTCFAVSYEIEDTALNGFEDAARAYTENQNPYMGYVTKADLVESFGGMNDAVKLLGVGLSAVI